MANWKDGQPEVLRDQMQGCYHLWPTGHVFEPTYVWKAKDDAANVLDLESLLIRYLRYLQLVEGSDFLDHCLSQRELDECRITDEERDYLKGLSKKAHELEFE